MDIIGAINRLVGGSPMDVGNSVVNMDELRLFGQIRRDMNVIGEYMAPHPRFTR